MTAYYINKGGVHAIGESEVRNCALTPSEFAITLPNSGVPSDTDNSMTAGEINLGRYKEFKSLAVGDSIFVELFPDAMLYRGLWALTQDSFAYKFDISLVDANDVFAAECEKGNVSEVEMKGSKLAFDGSKCLGSAASQAMSMGGIDGDCNAWLETNRNHTDALQSVIFPATKQFIAQIGHPLYLRMVVTAVPSDDDVCGTCGGLPCIQLGVIVDNICVTKGFITDQCSDCPTSSADCGDGEDCSECK